MMVMEGNKLVNEYGEGILCLREYWKLTPNQMATLTAQNINRHDWERFAFTGHQIFFFHKAWELGRMLSLLVFQFLGSSNVQQRFWDDMNDYWTCMDEVDPTSWRR